MDCHACLRRYLGALLASHGSQSPARLRSPVKHWTPGRSHIHLSTRTVAEAAPAEESPTPAERIPPNYKFLRDRKTVARSAPGGNRNRLNRQHPIPPTWNEYQSSQKRQSTDTRKTWTETHKGSRVASSQLVRKDSSSLRLQSKFLQQELKYLGDAVKLADHVRTILQRGDEEKALALVRLSKPGFSNTVSWNHIIDWQMSQGKTRAALDTFNELKKRGQRPDSHTFLLLLRGLAEYAHNPSSVERALALYHSMSLPNSSVRPSIIHTNAVLKVCARGNDSESLWDIASSLPDHGPAAANNWTFTTILNNMTMTATSTHGIPDETVEANLIRREKMVIDGRRLWNVILARWRKNSLRMDEQLVCAMGRLLLIGEQPRDWDDVLSLIEQTMAIPRLIPRLGTAERRTSGIPRRQLSSAEWTTREDEFSSTHQSTPASTSAEMVEDEEFDAQASKIEESSPPALVDPFVSIDEQPKGGVGGVGSVGGVTSKDWIVFAYAQPGNNTLSLILEACLKLFLKQTAKEYWETLTKGPRPRVAPDTENASMLLRTLRQVRAPAEAHAFLRDEFFATHNLVPSNKIFRLAISACARNSKSPQSLTHALGILEIMQQEMKVPDARSIAMVLDLAVRSASVRVLKETLTKLEHTAASLTNPENWEQDSAAFGGSAAAAYEKESRKEVLDLLQQMISVYDKLLYKSSAATAATAATSNAGSDAGSASLVLDSSEREELETSRHKLSALVNRALVAEREQRHPETMRPGAKSSVPLLQRPRSLRQPWQPQRSRGAGRLNKPKPGLKDTGAPKI